MTQIIFASHSNIFDIQDILDIQGRLRTHLCVNTLPASWQSVYTQM